MSRKRGFYERFVKRILDIICALLAIVAFCWLYGILAILVRAKLGSPVIFKQPRPGMVDRKTGQEKIFYLYKFRSMTNECDEKGELLPDEVRLTRFGKWLRATSLDELPEAFNILKGEMSLIGPRPQLVRDMVFMSDEQRLRHTAKPGLSGLAQVKGRNSISWEEKLNWDTKYIEDICFVRDVKIVLWTITSALIKKEGITEEDMATAMDYGDYLLKSNKISREEYQIKQREALEIIEGI